MNKVVLMGRLTRDPEVRYSQGESATAVARYTLAVERRFKREGEQTADSRLYSLCSIREIGRICREIFPSGTTNFGFRKDPDWQLYE